MLLSCLVLWILWVLLAVGKVEAKRSVVFKGKHTVSRALPDDFKLFFSREETPLEILNLNPGLERIEQSEKDSSLYTGYLTGIQFPGI